MHANVAQHCQRPIHAGARQHLARPLLGWSGPLDIPTLSAKYMSVQLI